jgi:hypothetical protein
MACGGREIKTEERTMRLGIITSVAALAAVALVVGAVTETWWVPEAGQPLRAGLIDLGVGPEARSLSVFGGSAWALIGGAAYGLAAVAAVALAAAAILANRDAARGAAGRHRTAGTLAAFASIATLMAIALFIIATPDQVRAVTYLGPGAITACGAALAGVWTGYMFRHLPTASPAAN